MLDAAGRLAGIVLGAEGGEALMLPASRWRGLAGAAPTEVSGTPPSARGFGAAPTRPMKALRLALQVIAPR